MEPFAEEPTLCLIANAVDPITKEGYGFDPRSVAQRAESYLKFTGVADTSYFGPEAEFFVFDGVEIENEQNAAGYRIHSDEGIWNYLKRVELANVCAPNLDSLQADLIRARERLRHKRHIILSCFALAGLSL